MFFNRQSKKEKLLIEQDLSKNLNSKLTYLIESHNNFIKSLFNYSGNALYLEYFSNFINTESIPSARGNTLEEHNKNCNAVQKRLKDAEINIFAAERELIRVNKLIEQRRNEEFSFIEIRASIESQELHTKIDKNKEILEFNKKHSYEYLNVFDVKFHDFCNKNPSFFENFVLYISDFYKNELDKYLLYIPDKNLYYDIETLLINNRKKTKQIDFLSTYLNKLKKSYEEINLLEKRKIEKDREIRRTEELRLQKIRQERRNKEKQKLELEKKEQELVLQKKRQQEEIQKKLKLEKTIQEEENNSRKQRKDDIMFILNRNFLAKQSIDNNNYYTIAHYFPVSLYPNVPSNISKHRTELWNIRENGNVDYFLDYFFKGNPIDFNVYTEDIIVSIIPSKTNYLSEIIFKKLCISISEKWKIQNGFSFIKVSNEREIIKDRESDKLLNIDFNTDVFKGKTIFLLSDMFPSRDMFLKYTNKLKDYEAKDVVGIFLAERYDAEIHGLPDWD